MVASNSLPVHITSVEKADAVYQKHAGQELLKVRENGLCTVGDSVRGNVL